MYLRRQNKLFMKMDNFKMEETDINNSEYSCGDFTKGSIPRLIIKLSLPMIIAQLVNVLYSICDRIFIGHLSSNPELALSGLGVSFPLISLILGFTNLFGSGGLTIFSIARGEGDNKKASAILQHSFYMLLTCSLITTFISLLFSNQILVFSGASQESLIYANTYLTVYILGTPFAMLATGLNTYISAQGFAKHGVMSIIIGAISNIILDPIFIYVLDMDVSGAALASVISQFLSASYVMVFLINKNIPVPLKIRQFNFNASIAKNIIALGTPGFIFQATNSLVQTVFNSNLYILGGDIHVATISLLNSIRSLLISTINGLTSACHPIMSYNYGASQYKRVRKVIRTHFVFCLVISGFFWLILMCFPSLFLNLFTKDPNFINIGSKALRIYFSMFFMMTFQIVGQTAFQGIGYASHAIFFSLLRKVFLVIPATYIIPAITNLGVWGIYLADPISQLSGAVITFITMYFVIWKKLNQENAHRLKKVK